MKKVIVLALSVFASSVFAEQQRDIEVLIINEGLQAEVTAQYIATADKWSCQETVWDDGSLKRIPKRRWKTIEGQYGSYIAPVNLGGKCKYQRIEGVSVGIKSDKATPYNTFTVFEGKSQVNMNTVVCKEAMRGPKKKKKLMIMCEPVRIEAEWSGLAPILIDLVAL